MSNLHPKIIEVTKRIAKRSLSSRQKYLNNITSMEQIMIQIEILFPVQIWRMLPQQHHQMKKILF